MDRFSTDSTDILVRLDDVSWRTRDTAIVQNVSLAIKRSEIVTLIGPNGAGKSTIVKLLSGLLSPTSGTVTLQSNLRIGYMPQRLNIDSTLPMDVRRFLALGNHDDGCVQDAIDRLGLKRVISRQLSRLSGGEWQRVLLARCVLRQPDLLILDEPTQGVDVHGQAELYELITQIRDDFHCGVLLVSHDLHLVMAKTDTVICLNHHICCHGAPESVSRHPAYLALFGDEAARSMAIYTHSHDHSHDLHGDVVDDDEQTRHGST